MPIYEYLCLDCSQRFETLRMIKDADVATSCVRCGSENTSRMLSLFNAQSGGKVLAGSNSGCTSCSGGSCAGCGVRH